MTTKEVAVQGTGLPASFGNVNRNRDLTLARVELLQGLSRKLKPESGFKDLRIGNLVNSISGEILEDIITPVFVNRKFVEEAINPTTNRKEIVFETTDDSVPHVMENSAWTTQIVDGVEKRIPPKVQMVLDFFVLVGAKPQRPMILTTKGTSLKAGVGLLDVAFARNEELYGSQFRIGSQLHRNGNTYVFTFTRIGETPDNIKALAIEGLKGLVKMTPKVEEEAAD